MRIFLVSGDICITLVHIQKLKLSVTSLQYQSTFLYLQVKL